MKSINMKTTVAASAQAQRGGAARALRALASMALAATALAGCGGSSDDTPICSDVSIAVDAGHIYGQWCRPPDGHGSKVLQVLVHGATYSHTYWNFPGFDGRYSYSNYMNRAGYATLAIDQLGVGKSTHPPSDQVTYATAAKAVAQVVSAVRAGALSDSYGKIVVVAHSIGSLVVLSEVAQYGGVDGMLLSGFSHSLGGTGFGKLTASIVPALNDPITQANIPAGDLGYLSVLHGRPVFYQSGDADPALIAADEATHSELSGSLNAADYFAVDASRIRVPVLVANGMNDIAFCSQGGGGSTTDCSSAATFRAAELPFFTAATPLEAYVLPNAGHNLNLTLQSQTWYGVALGWFQTHFPAN